MFRQYMEVRKLADSTRTNYIRMWDIQVEQQKKLLDFTAESNVYRMYHPMLVAMIGTAARVGEMVVNSM